MIAAIPAMLFVAAAPAAPLDQNQTEMVARISACGFSHVRASYESDLQSDVIIVGDEAASDQALECAAKTIDGSDFLINFEQQLAARYYATQQRLFEPRGKAKASAYLASRGLLEKVPDFATSGLDDATFAKKLEAVCGPSARGLLGSSYGPHTLNSAMLPDGDPDDQFRDAFSCLMAAAAVAGFDIGFVGNEASPAGD